PLPCDTIHQLFERHAAAQPEAPAVACGDAALTYGQLNALADGVAARLRKIGVAPDTLVGIYMERSVEMVAALLGVLKSGAAYLPLDPAYPRDRVEYMLADGQARIAITQSHLRDRLSAGRAELVCMDAGSLPEGAAARDTMGKAARSTDLAYTIYTSGSTGKPKGVQLPHGAVVNFLVSLGKELGIGGRDCLAGVASMSFDASVLDFFLPLTHGATLALATKEEAMDGRKLAVLLSRRRATMMHATPATWRLMVECGWTGDAEFRILSGGEALPAELAQELISRCGELINLYGPTETAVYSCVSRVTGDRVTLGRPLANTTIYILDKELQPVPVGIPGELYIGGAGVARGYLNRPEQTAERFVPDPFNGHSGVKPAGGSKLYRTGDLARYLPSGEIEYCGRADFQVKVRGFRIELGEVETALMEAQGVRAAVVVATGERQHEKRLVAYLVPDGQSPSPDLITSHLRKTLPEYMIPSAYVFLEKLPLSPNGKINRLALPSPTRADRRTEGAAYVAPRTPLEEQVLLLWSDALDADTIGVHDNFFEIGGHSLLAARIMARVRDAFGVDLPMTALFEDPTPSALAEAIEAALVGNSDDIDSLLAELES
ncbi:MAG TPA: amino acid adenylation domain-containing protein, partial [Chthonomonadales bacterium]|nr:amino acid adenylation domain-containing protein [Chthonomonadales bacterium]